MSKPDQTVNHRYPSRSPVWRAAAILAWSLGAGVVAVFLGACGGDEAGPSVDGRPAAPAAAAPADSYFVDRAAELGVDFVHFNGMSGEFYLPEVTGAGCGLLDYDADGDLDLYLVQGAMLGEGKTLADARFPPPSGRPPGDRLYRNDLRRDGGTVVLSFTDVTPESGLAPGDSGDYGMGVATGDYDNDGFVDLYVTNLGENRLYRNRGDGSFVDVTEAAGAGDRRWSVPAAFVDIDLDGWLDLFIGNYVDFSYRNHKTCLTVTGEQDYCGPNAYRGFPDRLLRNRGDGSFEDVTLSSGINAAYGPALGVTAADFNGDGWPDLYVANDGQPNQLWLNRGDGRFEDGALLRGAALNAEGFPEASMGVEAADLDGDGDEDLFMAHITGETNTFYRNDGTAFFDDRTTASGLGAASKWATGFGAGAYDFDNDGALDLLVVNGAVRTIEEQARERDPFPLRQPSQLFRNLGEGRFEEVSEAAGADLRTPGVGRGAAFGDVDNDGDTDVLVLNNNGPARLLINRVGARRSWLGLRIVGSVAGAPPRDQLGARVELRLADGLTLWRRVRTDGSFASANDPRVLFGLGDGATVDTVRVYWPGGGVEEWDGLEPGRYHELERGSGKSVS